MNSKIKLFLSTGILTTIGFTCIGMAYHSKLSTRVVLAHNSQLMIDYDICSPTYYDSPMDIGDGENEKWYENIQTWMSGEITHHICYHLPHQNNGVSSVRYYISDFNLDTPSLTWTTYLSSDRANYVKNAFVLSMQKWNNVFFYSKNTNGFTEKKRIIDISQGTSSNHNVTIYPFYDNRTVAPFATAGASNWGTGNAHYLNTTNGVEHWHVDNWDIKLNLFMHNPSNPSFNETESEFVLNRTGAHETGHVLGLWDIDECERINHGTENHHEELLMGYSDGDITTRQSEITYKDLVGAAITRGYHTDSDHQWMYDSAHSTTGNYKLICSICNGVKFVSDLPSYNYVTYGACYGAHAISCNNMIAVASYGNKDYYKCKYCRHVAPFTSLLDQEYVVDEYYDGDYHVTQSINGLTYSFLEEHLYTDHHTYSNPTYHLSFCECGAFEQRAHAVQWIDNGVSQYSYCIDCGALIDINIGGGGILPGPHSNDTMVTDNGSFILPNGILVIVEEDLDAYLTGTLVFHPYGEVSE